MASGPVIAVCIEVASPEILQSWLKAGWMPNLERLRCSGTWCPLESVAEISSGSIWPTFFTGVHPAKHGQFFTHMQIEPGTYRVMKKYADDVPRDPFWMDLHRAGKVSAIIDVPQTRPLNGFNGLHVAGWGGEYPAWKRSSSPRGLMREIIRRFGEHPLVDQYRLAFKPETAAQYERLKGELGHGVRTKAQLSRWLFDRGPFDLFLTVFAEPHWAAHLLWHTMDEGHPGWDDSLSPQYASTFHEIFTGIDRTIGELHAARPDADVLVFSLSGMGPDYSAWHVLTEVLERIGMAPGRDRHRAAKVWLPMARWGARRIRAVEDLVSLRTIETAKRLVPARLWDTWTRRILHAGSAWKDSRAFWVPNDYSGSIRVNLKGREPNGRVALGAEYEAVCDEITEALLELTDVNTGKKIVRQIVRTHDRYQGKYLDTLPDLLVLWANESLVNGVHSSKVGTIRCDFPARRTGAHRQSAVLVASGPRIRKGITLDYAHILDLAPTLLYLADVRVPDDYDGRVISEMLGS